MAKKIAPPKNTAGGGYGYEDQVAAYFLASMLANRPALEPELGLLTRIDFQTGPEKWILDDFLLEFHFGSKTSRIAVSAKSGPHLNSNGLNKDITKLLWELFLSNTPGGFDPSKDYMSVIGPKPALQVHNSIQKIIELAIADDPQLLETRIQVPNWVNAVDRALFGSFQYSAEIQNPSGRPTLTGSLLSRFKYIGFDFGDTPSAFEERAIDFCKTALRSGKLKEAHQLWKNLLTYATELRPKAGYCTRQRLLDKFRYSFEFATLADHGPDWNRLTDIAKQVSNQFTNKIGGQIEIQRDDAKALLKIALTQNKGVIFTGPSGIGKSAILKSLFESSLVAQQPFLFFDAASFDRPDFQTFQTNLGLSHTLRDLFSQIGAPQALLVIDGLDRIYSDHAYKLASSLLKLLDLERPESPWRVVITSQTQELSRVQTSLLKNGTQTAHWKSVECPHIPLDSLKPIWEKFPNLLPLQKNQKTKSLMTNLKILDLIASHLTTSTEDLDSWVGETHVAIWFWRTCIHQGTHGPQKAKFSADLAQVLADKLKATVSLYDLEISNMGPINELKNENFCKVTEDEQIAFTHDLYGDWARLHLLISQADNLPSFLKDRLESPMWHRAVRLYGLYLLEFQKDLNQWRTVNQTLSASENVIAQDLFLESILFAAHPRPLLETIYPDLIANDGQLLGRLLNRFLMFCTLPDPKMAAFAKSEGMDVSWVNIKYRYPNAYYWLPLIHFLHAHKTELIPLAPLPIAQIVYKWIYYSAKGYYLRKEAAEIGVSLGEAANELEDVVDEYEAKKYFYQAALIGADELPEEVSKFALKASKRSIIPVEPKHPIREVLTRPPFYRKLSKRGPWPLGPKDRVDRQFQEVVLSGENILPLFRAKPEIAKEVILAVLINSPREIDDFGSDRFDDFKLEIEEPMDWVPTLYIHGPFLSLLKENFEDGLAIILDLVHFATEQWEELSKNPRTEFMTSEKPPSFLNIQGEDSTPAADITNPEKLSVFLTINKVEKEFKGNGRVYGWSSGTSNPPHPIEAALMALEKYFYIYIEHKMDISQKIQTVLEKAKSTAFLRVLCDVGKLKPELFEGPLFPLFTAPEIYDWEIQLMVHGRFQNSIFDFRQGDTFVKINNEFNNMPHRNTDLRNLACWFLLSKPALQPLFNEARARWAKRLTADPKNRRDESMHRLDLMLNFENYAVVDHPEHGRIYQNKKLDEFQEKKADQLKEVQTNLFLTNFPVECYHRLENNKPLATDQLNPFWDKLQSVLKLEEDSEQSIPYPERAANAVMGGIAILVKYHLDWLEADSNKWEWCLNQITTIILNPPLPDGLDSPYSIAHYSWDAFAAEIIPPIWAKSQTNKDIRFLAARMIFAPHRSTLETFFKRCWENRKALGSGFQQLQQFLFEWANITDRLSYAQNQLFGIGYSTNYEEALNKIRPKVNAEVNQWANNRLNDFINGKIKYDLSNWDNIDAQKNLNIPGPSPQGQANLQRLDFGLIQSAYKWFPPLDKATSPEERKEWISFWSEALRYSLSRIHFLAKDLEEKRKAEKKAHQSDTMPYFSEVRDIQLYDFDHWALMGVAVTIQYMTPDENPEKLSSQILSLPKGAHDWIKYFFQDFNRYWLKRDPILPYSSEQFRKFFETCTNLEYLKTHQWPYHDEIWDTLIGVDSFSIIYWTERHQQWVKENKDIFEKWLSTVPFYYRRIVHFATWLEKPATKFIRLDALVWLEQIVTPSDSLEREKEAIDALASLVAYIWQHDAQDLRQHPEAFKAFKKMLQFLAEKQNTVALGLISQITE